MSIEDRISTTINSLLYVINKLGGEGDFHKIFKVLYFADQKHLARYGRQVTDDNYIAMNNGPVPSMAYDILKALRGEGLLESQKEKFSPYFDLLSKYIVKSKTEPDLDELSESELSCIDESIKENINLDFTILTKKSHDEAWQNTSTDCEMDILDIAKAAGANDTLLEYINNTRENHNAIFE